jgi:hypothetical protein
LLPDVSKRIIVGIGARQADERYALAGIDILVRSGIRSRRMDDHRA